MVREKEIICQEALQRVLEKEFPKAHYAIGNYKEDAICLEWDGKEWEVYYGFRNLHDQKTLYSTIVEACIGMINKLAHTKDLSAKLRDLFLELIVVDKIA